MKWPRLSFLHSSLALEIYHLARLFLPYRILLGVFAFFATASTQERHPNPDKLWEAFDPAHFFLNGFFHWDSAWYRKIAEFGYFTPLGLKQNNSAFFPLFPYLSRWLGMLMGSHLLAGVLISNVTFFLGLFFLRRIARRYFDEECADRTLLLVLIFPTSWFFSAYYTEGLFLFVTTASFYFFLNGNYLPCALFGALACATRSTGIALLPAFIAGLAWDRIKHRTPLRWSALALFFIPVGLAVFLWVLHRDVGDPLAFVKVQEGWGRCPKFPLATLFYEFSRVRYAFPRSVWNTDIFLAAIISVVFLVLPLTIIRRVHPSLVLFALLSIVIPLSSGLVMSMNRYAIVAFPSFLAMAHLARTRARERLLFFGLTLFLGFYTLQFFNWHWAG